MSKDSTHFLPLNMCDRSTIDGMVSGCSPSCDKPASEITAFTSKSWNEPKFTFEEASNRVEPPHALDTIHDVKKGSSEN